MTEAALAGPRDGDRVAPALAHARSRGRLWVGGAAVVALAATSVFIGVSDVSPASLLSGDANEAAELLLATRIPRTLSLILAGIAVSIAGLIMQVIVRNRFVEPSTTGTTEAATLGLLVVTVVAPTTSLLGKMTVASVFALAGAGLFLLILRRIPIRTIVLVPLVGIMLGGVIGALTTFFAYRLDLLQTLGTWMMGDFSGVIRGRYELLWLAFATTVVAWLVADRFTVAGLGRDFASSLGLHHGRVLALGLVIVSVVTATVVVTVGVVPFLGLVVPNIAGLMFGDNVRRSVVWVAILGAGFVLVCDIVGRIVRFPYEVPLGVVVGVAGAALFLFLVLRKSSRVH